MASEIAKGNSLHGRQDYGVSLAGVKRMVERLVLDLPRKAEMYHSLRHPRAPERVGCIVPEALLADNPPFILLAGLPG